MLTSGPERDRAPLSIPDLNDYKRDASSVDGFAPFTNWTANLTGAGEAERLEGVRVSGDFFPLIGSSAMLGRSLQPSDEAEARKVAVLTHGLWNRRFGGDSTIVGRTIDLNGAGHTVVGVMPAGFVFPFRDAEIAVPIALPRRPAPDRSWRKLPACHRTAQARGHDCASQGGPEHHRTPASRRISRTTTHGRSV